MYKKKYHKKRVTDNPLYDKFKVKKPTNLKAKLDKVFAEFIRLRDTMPNGFTRCISCGKIIPYAETDCGHYLNRQHTATRFDEMNCNAQCRSCNRFDEGNIVGYRRGLVNKYGEKRVLLLESRKYDVKKYSEFEYKVLIDYYQKKVKELRKEKDL